MNFFQLHYFPLKPGAEQLTCVQEILGPWTVCGVQVTPLLVQQEPSTSFCSLEKSKAHIKAYNDRQIQDTLIYIKVSHHFVPQVLVFLQRLVFSNGSLEEKMSPLCLDEAIYEELICPSSMRTVDQINYLRHRAVSIADEPHFLFFPLQLELPEKARIYIINGAHTSLLGDS